jgi:hypothetical protein
MLHRLVRSAYARAKASPWIRSCLRHPTLARWKAALACRWMARDRDYEAWLTLRRQARAKAGYGPPEPNLISFLTTVWNTPPEFLRAMADSLLAQSPHREFEWILLDNGTVRADTRAELARIATDSRVRSFRVEENLGIVGGMRLCLERATGQYIAPVDSDDLLEPDAVAIITQAVRQAHYPAIAYTDEDHLLGAKRVFPYFKPDWDPVLFFNSAFIAHLGVVDRTEALRLGVYTEPAANGCHDWDTFERFLAAGLTPVHIPEITYSWRMHAQSTAANVSSKSYIHTSHQTVLGRAQARLPRPERFQLELSPLFQGTPDWWYRRTTTALPEVVTVHIGPDSGSGEPAATGSTSVRLPLLSGTGLLRAIEQAPAAQYVALVDSRSKITRQDWIAEAIGLCERFPDTAVVGGRLLSADGRILAASYRATRAGEAGTGDWVCPDAGRLATDSGYFAQMWKQRSVTGVSMAQVVLTRDFALALAARLETDVSWTVASLAAADLARAQERRVVYTPFIEATGTGALVPVLTQDERRTYADWLEALADDRRWYPAALGDREAYRPDSSTASGRPESSGLRAQIPAA